MALDFKLDLIMPEQNCRIFCHSSLEATCYLVKRSLPEITQQLQQDLQQPALPIDEQTEICERFYYVNLSLQQVMQLTELLIETCEVSAQGNTTSGLMDLAMQLYQEWQPLADELLSQASDLHYPTLS